MQASSSDPRHAPCSFCRACIDAALPEAGRSAGAQCPACAEAGEAVMLGARPYADRRLQPDVVLAELARKLFPASDPRREEAFRIARVSCVGTSAGMLEHASVHDASETCAMACMPLCCSRIHAKLSLDSNPQSCYFFM